MNEKNVCLEYARMAEIAEKKNNYQLAVTLYARSNGAGTDEVSFLRRLAKLKRKAGMFREALVDLRKIARLKGYDLESLFDLGIAYTDLGVSEKRDEYFDLAIACYRRAVRLAPDNARTWYNVAIAFLHRGNITEAKRCLRNAIRMAPDEPRAYYSLANIYKNDGNLEAAVRLYKKSLKLDPEFDEAWYNLGTVFDSLGLEEDARYCYEKAATLKPNHYIIRKHDGKMEVRIRENEFTSSVGPR